MTRCSTSANACAPQALRSNPVICVPWEKHLQEKRGIYILHVEYTCPIYIYTLIYTCYGILETHLRFILVGCSVTI